MVGGRVKETLIIGDRVWVNARDTTYRDECAIYVERNPNSERIQPGDMIWWQGRSAMWTPAENLGLSRCGVDYDIEIPRIGYSGVSHPGKKLFDRAFAGDDADDPQG
jgi:hypothetical protein